MWLKLAIFLSALAILFSLWQHKNPYTAVVEMVDGVVADDPVVLAGNAAVDIETYSLARVGQSEEGLSSARAKIAVMYATKRHAAAKGKTITDVVTKGNPKRTDFAAADGRYGRQGIHPYCSTIAAPTANTLSLAQQVIDGTATDETQGAQYWDNPHTQDLLHTANPHNDATGKGYYSSDEIAAHREAGGLTMVVIDGIGTRFWV